MLIVVIAMIMFLLSKWESKINIGMKIKRDTLTKEGVWVIISNQSNNTLTFGEWFKLEKKESDQWVELNTKSYTFKEANIKVEKNEQTQMQVDFTQKYEVLEPGEYRLVKNVFENSKYTYFSVEFEIK